MKNPIVLLILVLLVAGGLAIYLLNRKPAPSPPPEEATAAPGPTVSPPQPPVSPGAAPSPPAAGPEEEMEAAEAEDATPATAADLSEVPLPPGYPRSQVPHRVAKAWGRDADGSAKSVVGMTIVVDPATSDLQLNQLAEDVLEANCDAPRMSVRIYDSEDALDSDLHKRHDPKIAEHTIGNIWVNPGENRYRPKVRIKIRGQDTELAGEDLPTGEACDPSA